MSDQTFAKSTDLQSHISQDHKTVHNIYPNLSFIKTYARAYRATDLTPSYDAWTTMTLDTESADAGGNFAANTYTCPSAGRYLVQAGLYFRHHSADTNATVTAAIYKGSTLTARIGKIMSWFADDDQYWGIAGGDILNCASGDTILFKYYCTGYDVTFQGGTAEVFMAVQRIS